MPTTAVRRSLAAAGCLALTATFAACGKDDTPDPADAAGSPPSTAEPRQGAPAFPGASGEVVAVSGSTAQVRSQRTGQVAVSWTDATTFTATTAGQLADLTVGSCVVIIGSTDDEPATTVTVAEAVDGECRTPAAGRSGGRDRPEPPEGFEPPAGMERPEGMPDRAPVTAGRLSAIEGTTLTVGEETVEVAADARITLPTTATAADVEVGSCLTAQGETDSVGAVAATTVAVSEKVDGECGVGGLGGLGGGFPGRQP